jgi:hypothetical protein
MARHIYCHSTSLTALLLGDLDKRRPLDVRAGRIGKKNGVSRFGFVSFRFSRLSVLSTPCLCVT